MRGPRLSGGAASGDPRGSQHGGAAAALRPEWLRAAGAAWGPRGELGPWVRQPRTTSLHSPADRRPARHFPTGFAATRLSAHRGFHHNHPKLDGTSRLSSDRRMEQPRAPRQQPAAGEWAAESRERTDARGSAPQAQTPGAGARAARRAQAAEPPCRAQERRRVASSARPNPGNLTAQSGPRSAQIRRARDLGRSRGDEPCNVRVREPLPGGADSVAVEKRGVPDAGGRRIVLALGDKGARGARTHRLTP